MLLAARLNPSAFLEQLPYAELERSWERALCILRGFQNDNTSAKHCVTVLQLLYDRLTTNQKVNSKDPVANRDSHNLPPEMHPLESHHVTARHSLDDTSDFPVSSVIQEYEWFNSLTDMDFADMSWLSAVPGALFSDPE